MSENLTLTSELEKKLQQEVAKELQSMSINPAPTPTTAETEIKLNSPEIVNPESLGENIKSEVALGVIGKTIGEADAILGNSVGFDRFAKIKARKEIQNAS